MSLIPSQDKIILEMRRHIFFFYIKALGTILIAVILPILFFLFIHIFNIPLTEHILSFFILVYSLVLVATWLHIFVSWTIYTLDVWILTDKQVIDFMITSLFHHDTATVGLDKIQDIKVEVNGILASIIKSGDLHIQTAGSNKELLIRGAYRPQEMKMKILEAMNEFRNRYHDHTPSV